jgi:hypothetical protein
VKTFLFPVVFLFVMVTLFFKKDNVTLKNIFKNYIAP